jgi:hypothetical protein
MSIIDPQLVNIEIAILPDCQKSGLRLNYQGQIYDLIQAFADRKLDFAQQKLSEQLSRSNQLKDDSIDRAGIDRYSLWELNRSTVTRLNSIEPIGRHQIESDLELQQASIWLFQELWLQWQNLMGSNQLQVFADNLLTLNPHLQSWVDLDRLLAVDPLASTKLAAWSESDLIAFDRQIYDLTQKKIGQKFGVQLTSDIVQSMPDSLRMRLSAVLDI